jgi:hypothetical protein
MGVSLEETGTAVGLIAGGRFAGNLLCSWLWGIAADRWYVVTIPPPFSVRTVHPVSAITKLHSCQRTIDSPVSPVQSSSAFLATTVPVQPSSYTHTFTHTHIHTHTHTHTYLYLVSVRPHTPHLYLVST